MRLIEEWHEVLTRAWSIRLILAAIVLSFVEVLLTVLSDRFIDILGDTLLAQIAVALLLAIVTPAAFIARLVAQRAIGSRHDG